ncbi:MAG: hypothetical protein U0797_11775 [Gemmataceae bacterium]
MNNPPRPTYAWWIILCLVGLDYFSSIAYLPSIAMTVEEGSRDLAPVAGVGVVLVTLLAALPVYWYVVARSPHGKGGVGLLERHLRGWGGKLFILALLGFIATDFVLTRTLSVSDAATHLLNNPYYEQMAPSRSAAVNLIDAGWWRSVVGFFSEQLVVTIVLSVLAFGLYHYLVQTLSRGFVSLAVGVVLFYLLVNGIVIGSGLAYLNEHPTLMADWKARLLSHVGEERVELGAVGMLLLFGLKLFPPMAIGLSGFELTMASAPSVAGGESDTEERPTGRIWRTRLVMVVAVFLMAALVLGSTTVAPLLIDPEQLRNPATGAYEHRALSYLAHGGLMVDNSRATNLSGMFGQTFGTLYDLSTILILCLAGAGATIGMREIVPAFLSRFGMELSWAHRLGVITHLFNAVILLVTIAFRASVSAQLWAYATAVIALLFGASLAAWVDSAVRWRGYALGVVARLPWIVTTLLFAAMGLLIVYQQPAGVAIALLFVLVVLVTAITSRWLRSTEARFEGFEFIDDHTRQRWEEVRTLEKQVLVPHDPTHATIEAKEHEIRDRHRIGPDVPIIFIEVQVGDPSDFFQRPLMKIGPDDEGREIIRVWRATSVAHVLAAIGLAFREVGHPPELFFKWSTQSPMEATLNFLLLGQGNVPMLVRTLVHNAEPDPLRRPRVIVADG